MARYKPQDRNSLLLPVVLSEQLLPGSFAFALDYLVDNELDLNPLDDRFKNDEVGASAYDPRVMLKIVLLAYSQGLISSRSIEQACARNVQFVAISGEAEIAAHFGHEHSILENQSARGAKPAWGARKPDFFTASLGVLNFNNGGKYEDNDLQTTRWGL